MQLQSQSLFGTLVQVGGEAQVDSRAQDEDFINNQVHEDQLSIFRGISAGKTGDSSWRNVQFVHPGPTSYDTEGNKQMLNQLFLINGQGAATIPSIVNDHPASVPTQFLPREPADRILKESCRELQECAPLLTTHSDWRHSYDLGSSTVPFYSCSPANIVAAAPLGASLNPPPCASGIFAESQNLNRRFSLAVPSGHLLVANNGLNHQDSGETQLENYPSNLLFVMEDPSGKEPLKENEEYVIARRHSMGAPHLYCCPWTGCNKVFNRFYNLRSHYRIHSGEKPFSCNYCDASFARNHDLKRHERIHLKTKPFTCPVCNKAFSRNDAMNRHVRLNSCSKPNPN